MRYDEKPSWAKRDDSWWSLYGRAVRWFSVMYGFVALPLVILFFVDKAQALEKLRILGISTGIYLALAVPTVWWYNRRDGATMLEDLQEQPEVPTRKPKSHAR